MNFFFLVKLLFKCKFRFTFPKHKKVLINDESMSDFVFTLIKKEECEILHTRFEEINILILLLAILNLSKERLSKKYVDYYIKCVNPKVILTINDNKLSFYELKKNFNNILFISIQNGLRNYESSFYSQKKIDNLKKKDLSVDYFFVLSKSYENAFSQFIKGKIIVSGSLKNNSVPISNKKNSPDKKKLLYISQFRDVNAQHNKKGNEIRTTAGKMNFIKYFLKSEIKLIPLLVDYCDRHNIILEICACMSSLLTIDSKKEFLFYKSLIKDEFKSWQFFPRKNIQTTYNMLDEATAVAFIDSTLGYEALSRKRPTACFSIRGEIFDNFDGCKFGRPAIYQDAGPFWCNYLNAPNLNNILDFVLNVSDEDWRKVKDKYANKLMSYDKGNTKFKNIMKNLNIPLVSEN